MRVQKKILAAIAAALKPLDLEPVEHSSSGNVYIQKPKEHDTVLQLRMNFQAEYVTCEVIIDGTAQRAVTAHYNDGDEIRRLVAAIETEAKGAQ